MNHGMEDQFETLESAHDFVALLATTVAETKRDLEGDVERESTATRRREALRIALYNLAKLELHVNQSRGFSTIFAHCVGSCSKSEQEQILTELVTSKGRIHWAA